MFDNDLIIIEISRSNYNLLMDSLELLKELCVDFAHIPESLADRVWCEVDNLSDDIRERSHNV